MVYVRPNKHVKLLIFMKQNNEQKIFISFAYICVVHIRVTFVETVLLLNQPKCINHISMDL